MSINISKLFDNLEKISVEKSIDLEKVIDILKHSLEKAYLKENPDVVISTIIDPKKKTLNFMNIKIVVDKSEDEIDDDKEINISEAREFKNDINLGDEFITEINIDDFERRIAVHALQIFQQKLNEESNLKIYDAWKDKVDQVVIAEVEKNENRYVEVNLDTTMGIVLKNEQIPNETLSPGKKYMFLIKEIKQQTKGWPVILSRSSPKLIEALLYYHIPEIASGIIKIESIARVPGYKTKIAVSSNDPNVDAIGTCVGPNGDRIKNIASMVSNEKIDIFLYSKNIKQFIVNMCAPGRVIGLEISDDSNNEQDNHKIVTIVCQDEDLSKIIGKNGVHVKLMSMLTKWSIDVVTLEFAIENKIDYEDVTDLVPIKYLSNRRSFGYQEHYPNLFNKNNAKKSVKSNEDSYQYEYSQPESNDWLYDDVTDEDVENLLDSNKDNRKKRKNFFYDEDDEDEVIFVSKADKNNVDNENEDNNDNEVLIKPDVKETKEEKIEISDEIIKQRNYKNKQSIDEFFDSMENEFDSLSKKKNKKSPSKPKSFKQSEPKKEKKKIDILDEYDDILEEDYDDSNNIDLDDIDYDEFE